MQTGCPECNFDLYIPVAELSVSRLGLYPDSRYFGRCLLVLNEHHEAFEELPEDLMLSYMVDVRKSIHAIKGITGSQRVNLAVLGNREPHVHAHLIPRYAEQEEFPDCSPWNDKRPNVGLKEEQISRFIADIAVTL